MAPDMRQPRGDGPRGDSPATPRGRRGLRAWMVSAGNLTALLVIYFAVPMNTKESPAALLLGLAATLAAVAVAGWIIAREVRRQLNGEDRGLTGIHLVLLLEIVLLVFALTYYALAVKSDHQIAGIQTRLDALYFAATTMTTVGYGDIHAVGQLARAIVALHLVFDVIFVTALAGLAKNTLQMSGSRARREPPPRSPGHGEGESGRQ